MQWDQHRKAGIQETAEIDQETAICEPFQFEQKQSTRFERNFLQSFSSIMKSSRKLRTIRAKIYSLFTQCGDLSVQ